MSEEIELEFTPGAEDTHMLQQFLSMGGAPAFVLRSKRAEMEWDLIIRQCQRQRNDWLNMVKLRLGTLRELAGNWDILREYVAEEQNVVCLKQLYEELKPQLRVPVAQSHVPKVLRRALRELHESIDFFNRRWTKYLEKIDLFSINHLREKHNEYYVLEKECVIQSPLLARRHFEPLQPLTSADLLRRLPLLPTITPKS